MKENDVVALAGLLGKSAEDVGAAIENGGVSEFIESYTGGHTIMASDDFDTFKTNLANQTISDLAKAERIPKPIYDRVKGTVLELTEKQVAEKHGVSDYSGFDDLLNKVITKAENPTEDVKALKDQIELIQAQAAQKEQELLAQNDTRYADLRLSEAVKSLPIDAGDDKDKLEKQRQIVRTMFDSEHKVRVDGNSLVVQVNKDGEWKDVVDAKLDPIPYEQVLSDYAKGIVNLKSPAGGGRGDKSSTGSKGGEVNFAEYCEKNNIPPNSFKMIEAKKKLTADGYTLV